VEVRGQRIDDLVVAIETVRPAVQQKQGGSILFPGGPMNEMQVDLAYRDLVVRQGVQLRLGLSPVVLVQPIVGQRVHITKIGSEHPFGIGGFVGPARMAKTRLEIGELRIRKGDLESCGPFHGVVLR